MELQHKQHASYLAFRTAYATYIAAYKSTLLDIIYLFDAHITLMGYRVSMLHTNSNQIKTMLFIDEQHLISDLSKIMGNSLLITTYTAKCTLLRDQFIVPIISAGS